MLRNLLALAAFPFLHISSDPPRRPAARRAARQRPDHKIKPGTALLKHTNSKRRRRRVAARARET